MGRALSLLIMLALWLAAQRAWADTPPASPEAPVPSADSASPAPLSYEQLVHAAIDAQERGDFDTAHALFEQAFAQRPNARPLRGMGIASYQAGLFTRAIAELEAALKNPERPLEGTLRSGAEEILRQAKSQLGNLSFEVSPADTVVFVDQTLEPLPVSEPLALDPGPHTLRFSADGHIEQELGIDLAPSSQQTLRVSLRVLAALAPPVPVPATIDASTVQARPTPAQGSAPSPKVSAAATARERKKRQRIALWSSLALAGAAAVTSAGLLATTSYRIARIEEACNRLAAKSCSQAQLDGLEDEGNLPQLATGFYVGVGVTAASVLTAGVLWYTVRLKGAGSGVALSDVAISPHGMFLRGTF